MTQHPIQPSEIDADGIRRFKQNPIVRWLLEQYTDLNKLAIARQRFKIGTDEDYDQFLQLIGYSVSGAPLSDKTRERVDAAENMKLVDNNAAAVAYVLGATAAKQTVARQLQAFIDNLGDLT